MQDIDPPFRAVRWRRSAAGRAGSQRPSVRHPARRDSGKDSDGRRAGDQPRLLGQQGGVLGLEHVVQRPRLHIVQPDQDLTRPTRSPSRTSSSAMMPPSGAAPSCARSRRRTMPGARPRWQRRGPAQAVNPPRPSAMPSAPVRNSDRRRAVRGWAARSGPARPQRTRLERTFMVYSDDMGSRLGNGG